MVLKCLHSMMLNVDDDDDDDDDDDTKLAGTRTK